MDRKALPIGTQVRLYGFPGVFVYEGPYENPNLMTKYPQGMFRKGDIQFPTLYDSVVEYDGVPLPLVGTPIAPPASDYPHEPQFEYNPSEGTTFEVFKARADEAKAFWDAVDAALG